MSADERGTGREPPGESGSDRGQAVAGGPGETVELSVPEMDCASCAEKVTNSVSRLDGVAEIDARPTAGRLRVQYDPSRTDRGDVRERVEAAGYGVAGVQDDGESGEAAGSVWTSGRAIKTWTSAALLAVGLAVEYGLGGLGSGVVLSVEFTVADVLFLTAVAIAGQEILRDGYYSARNRSLDIDFLMSVAIVAAVAASLLSPDAALYSEAATLAVLFSLAELLESYSMDRTRDSLRELMDLSPEEATVRREDEEVTVPIDAVSVGDTVVVRPGEKIPVDGVVTEGDSAVDEAPITGESVPVNKVDGDDVYAGTINQGGYLEVEVTATPGEDTLSRVVDLVEDAGAGETESEQFVDRFSGYYTPVMVALAVVVAVVPPLAFDAPWITWFVAGITMLVLACPCAFVISTPVTVVSGITSAAKNGVLVKGGDHLEAMGRIDAVALDKTGTITEGQLAVTDVIPVGDRDETDVLECARGLEERSEHPIGDAIVDRADGADVTAGEVADFESLTGEGVRASLDGTTHYAGKPALFEGLGFDLGHVHVVPKSDELESEVRDLCDRQGCLNLMEDTVPRLQREGKTVVLVGREDELEGIVAVADEIRPGAREAVSRLQDLGVEVVMLTGDNERTARAVAEAVGVDDYRAELLPEDKVAAVEELEESYARESDGGFLRWESGGVAMVGDGINDAPALAAATVGIAMGAAGTDTAIETADVALLGDDVSKLPYLYDLAGRANSVIRQNVFASLGMKALLAVGVPLQVVSVAAAVLLGDAGMTVGVTGNAMRLSRLSPDESPADATQSPQPDRPSPETEAEPPTA